MQAFYTYSLEEGNSYLYSSPEHYSSLSSPEYSSAYDSPLSPTFEDAESKFLNTQNDMFVELATQSDNVIHSLSTNFHDQSHNKMESNPFQAVNFTAEVNPFHQMRTPQSLTFMPTNAATSTADGNAMQLNAHEFQQLPNPIYYQPDQSALFAMPSSSLTTTTASSTATTTASSTASSGGPNPLSISMDVIQKNLKRGRAEELSVVMSKDVLAKATCADLDALVKKVQDQRELTEIEEHAIKRQRRLIKNRDYSATSRNKTKNEIAELQNKNKILQQEKEILNQNISILQRENARLMFENSQYRATLSGLGYGHTIPNSMFPTSQQSAIANSYSNLPSSTGPQINATQFTVNVNGHQFEAPQGYTNYATPTASSYSKSNVATLTIFVIIFSFGLFFGPSLLASSTFDQTSLKGSSRALFGSGPGFLFTPSMGANTHPQALNQFASFPPGQLPASSAQATLSWFGLGFGLGPSLNLSQVNEDQSSQPEKVA